MPAGQQGMPRRTQPLQPALGRQDLSPMYLAHHELESVITIVITIIIIIINLQPNPGIECGGCLTPWSLTCSRISP